MTALSEYGYVFIFLAIGVAFVLVNSLLPYLIMHKSRGERAHDPYESGEVPLGPAWIRFDIHYYLYALIFLVFDIEVIFLYPWAVVGKQVGLFAFYEMAFFLLILLVGYVYIWKKKGLEWQ